MIRDRVHVSLFANNTTGTEDVSPSCGLTSKIFESASPEDKDSLVAVVSAACVPRPDSYHPRAWRTYIPPTVSMLGGMWTQHVQWFDQIFTVSYRPGRIDDRHCGTPSSECPL